MNVDTIEQIRNHPAFLELERQRSVFGWTLAAIMMVIYYGFILVLAFAPEVMAIRVGSGVMTLGFPLGLGVILSAIVLTGIYVLRANGQFDRLTRQIVASVR